MTEEKKIFFPLFYNTLEITESLSDAEFGLLIRELLRSRGSKTYSPSLTDAKLMLSYCFMLDTAMRIFNTYSKSKAGGKGPKDNTREYNFDAVEAFEMALARSYGESE